MLNEVLVRDRALNISQVPVVSSSSSLKEALDKMTEFRLGIALIIGPDFSLVGVLTDGDLRRLLLRRQSPLPALLVSPAIEFGTTAPKSILPDAKLSEARELMAKLEVWDLPVVDEEGHLLGLLHRHAID